MKKLISLLLSVFLLATTFCACATNPEPTQTEEKTLVRVAGMKGPTSIGMVGIMEDNSQGVAKNDYSFSIEGSADAITPKLIKGELDIAAVPANLASVLYNNTQGEIEVLAVNTLGVLYILTKGETVEDISDLRGKTVITTGKGTTPEYTLRHILIKNGIDPDKDVNIEFKSEATEVVAAVSKLETAVVMLPQPYVTVACGKVEGLEIAIDLNEEWKKASGGNSIVTGVVVVRKAFAEQNSDALKSFLEEYKKSVELVNSNAENAAELVVKHGIFDNKAVIQTAIPKCNITLIYGNEMVEPINNYLGVLYEQNNKSVGGKLPEADFFRVLG